MERQSWINLGKDGTFTPTGKLASTPEDVDWLIDRLIEDGSQLVLHFHGGLVSEDHGLKTAEAMAANYGALPAISLIWETGLTETVRDNLLGITNTKVFEKALCWVLAKAGGGDLQGAKGPGGGDLDPAAIEAMLADKDGARALDKLLAKQATDHEPKAKAKGPAGADLNEDTIALDLELDFAKDRSLPTLVDNEAPGSEPIRRLIESEPGNQKGVVTFGSVALFLARVIIAVVRRYRGATHHDPLPTAVEELLRAAYLADVGKYAWDVMKVKAQHMWIDNGATPGVDGHVGGYLLRRLEHLQSVKPNFKIDAVGHSAGAIAICQMLAAINADKRKVKLRNIVFLAPAVRLDLFARWIPRGPQIFERFRSFTMTDVWEKDDQLLGSIYPRSLLYLVSGCFEDQPDTAIAGMERFLRQPTTSAGRDYDDVREWLKADNRVVYAPSDDAAGDGLRTRAQRHGDFDDDKMTLGSLLSMARGA
jgi:hypothetical protein